jgi:hypothetical protein
MQRIQPCIHRTLPVRHRLPSRGHCACTPLMDCFRRSGTATCAIFPIPSSRFARIGTEMTYSNACDPARPPAESQGPVTSQILIPWTAREGKQGEKKKKKKKAATKKLCTRAADQSYPISLYSCKACLVTELDIAHRASRHLTEQKGTWRPACRAARCRQALSFWSSIAEG